jgi:hypothetical protein
VENEKSRDLRLDLMPGTKNSGRRKLTEEQREAIRSSPDKLNVFLAMEYGVSRGFIYKLRSGSKTDLPSPRTKDDAPHHNVSPHEQAEPERR